MERSPKARKALVTMLAVALVALPAPFAGSASAAGPPPLQPATTDRYQALPLESTTIPTRGGDVYVEIVRPDVPAGTRVPIILTFTPYAAFLESADDNLASFFVPKGYARALAHVPGTGNSGGCWDYGGIRERNAGLDLVEWLGTRPWSTGRVGMIGGSYDGTTANMAAVARPPHLATIVPEVAISQWYGYAYEGGVRYTLLDPAQHQGLVIDEEGVDTPLAFDFGLALAPPLGPFDETYADHMVERLCPEAKARHTEEGYDFEPDFDAFWKERSYLLQARNVNVPVLVQSGWRDYNVKFSESTRWFEALPSRVPKMLIMDQVPHGTPDDPGFQWETLLHAWFDRYLYGFDTNVEDQPAVQSKANDGRIRTDRQWPPSGSAGVSLNLQPQGTLGGAAPSGAVGSYTDTGRTTESDALNFGSSTGELLWFESAPLSRDVRIAGTPSLQLRAESSATSTHFTPVLFDLGPPVSSQAQCEFIADDQACTMGRGFLNARYRDGLAQGQDLVPGEPYTAAVRFLGNDWVVPAGHRIGLAVMSSNAWWALSDQQRATTTVLGGSSLVLPVVGGSAAAAAAGLQ